MVIRIGYAPPQVCQRVFSLRRHHRVDRSDHQIAVSIPGAAGSASSVWPGDQPAELAEPQRAVCQVPQDQRFVLSADHVDVVSTGQLYSGQHNVHRAYPPSVSLLILYHHKVRTCCCGSC